VPFFYLVCTATRLARFNVQTRIVDSRYFVGLPTPAAAGAVCSILFFQPDSLVAPDSPWKTWLQLGLMVALLLIGLLMVSTFRYQSFKKLDLRKRWSYRAAVPVAAVIAVIATRPRATFLAIAALYTLSGPIAFLLSRLRGRRRASGNPVPPIPPRSEP
jgi:CDP-diacylglycerol--serine O-phosphatidyltransferase